MRQMKFNSRKGTFFSCVTGGFTLISSSIALWSIFNQQFIIPAVSLIPLLLVSGLLLWIYFGTAYELTQEYLKYQSGFLRGTIHMDRIHTVVKNETLWSGIKPATAGGGLIIKFDKYSEIYISPDTNDSFLATLQSIKKEIRIEGNPNSIRETPQNQT